MIDYAAFLDNKRLTSSASGFEVELEALHPDLFAFQRDLVRWALRKGRCALFCTTGMGKTAMQLEWARHVHRVTGRPVLILAPLAVAQQTVAEGHKFGIDVTYARAQTDAAPGLTIANYEMLSHFDPSAFAGVVLDESSILKALEGKTRAALTAAFRATPYRLCCTATPAPNDHAELANHAEFLGIMSRVEMLAAFFVHDDAGWRLKGHAREPFYRWLASWSISLLRPSDLGYDDAGFDLPGLTITPHLLPAAYTPPGQLFATTLKGVGDRAAVRRATAAARVAATVDLIGAAPDEPWIVWCGLNSEQDALAAALGSAAISIYGSLPPDEKVAREARWRAGEAPVLITKPTVMGWGMNWQHCARMAFVGLSDSYEQYFQCIRRCYRFGQARPVQAHIVLTEPEEVIYANVLRKEQEAATLMADLVRHVAAFERAEIGAIQMHDFAYSEREASGRGWRLLLGDSTERLAELPDASVDLSIFSPPFQSLYTYSPTERDLGNSRSEAEFWQHFGFISRELRRVVRPGRNICVHVAQITSTKANDGVIGLKDFRGATIDHFRQAGFVYHGEVCIDKDPQAQAIRTHSKALLFVQLRKDASWLRPALADYILVFRTPGENAVPVLPDISNDEWIEWARPIWYGIRETHTLNVAVARSDDDERHICPLQLGVIERCIRLWSNRGETVLSPFAGIGSECYEAVRLGRQAIGVELKAEYWRVAVDNLRMAEHIAHQPTLFDCLPAGNEGAA